LEEFRYAISDSLLKGPVTTLIEILLEKAPIVIHAETTHTEKYIVSQFRKFSLSIFYARVFEE
jgi:hypothetical protein